METTCNKYKNPTGLGTEAIPVGGELNSYLPCHLAAFSPMSKPQPLQYPHHCRVQNIPRVLRCSPGLPLQRSCVICYTLGSELKPSLEGCASNQAGMNNFHQTPLYFMSRFCHLVWTKIHLMNTALRHGVSLLTRHCSLPDIAALAGDTVSAQGFGTGCHTSCGGVCYKIMVKQTSASVM